MSETLGSTIALADSSGATTSIPTSYQYTGRECDADTEEGNKSDSATICRFRNRMVDLKLWDELLILMNQSLAERGLKVAGGRYVSTDNFSYLFNREGLKVAGGRYVSTCATLIHSARRPRKHYKARKELEGSYEIETEPVYADDKQARYVIKGGKLVDGYAAAMSTDERQGVEAMVEITQQAYS